MLSEDNIKLLEERKQPFIVGARIKNMAKDITAKVLDKTQYKELYTPEEEQEPVTCLDISIKENEQRLIVTHSPIRAEKDKYDREKAIAQLTQEINQK